VLPVILVIRPCARSRRSFRVTQASGGGRLRAPGRRGEKSACRSRLRKPLRVNSPRLTAASSGLSSPRAGGRAPGGRATLSAGRGAGPTRPASGRRRRWRRRPGSARPPSGRPRPAGADRRCRAASAARQAPLRLAFLGAVDAEVVAVVDGRLGAEHAAQRGERLLVQLQRVAVHACLMRRPSGRRSGRSPRRQRSARARGRSRECVSPGSASRRGWRRSRCRGGPIGVEPPQLPWLPEDDVQRHSL